MQFLKFVMLFFCYALTIGQEGYEFICTLHPSFFSQRENHKCDQSGQPGVRVSFLSYPVTVPGVIHMPCGLGLTPQSQATELAEIPKVCPHYAVGGISVFSSGCLLLKSTRDLL